MPVIIPMEMAPIVENKIHFTVFRVGDNQNLRSKQLQCFSNLREIEKHTDIILQRISY